MKVATHITKVKMVISRGLATHHPVKLAGILVLGALLMAGTAVHFAPESDDKVGNPASVQEVQASRESTEVDTGNLVTVNESSGETLRLREQQRLADSIQEVTEFFGEDVVAALGHEVLDAKLNHYQVDGPLTSRKMERLDQEIDMMLVAAANKSSEARAAYNRQVEHLERKISSILAEASHSPPSTNMSRLSREVERLDYQINVLQLAAMQQQ